MKSRWLALLRVESGRSPHGERGLKSRWLALLRVESGRSPHGERGLKWPDSVGVEHEDQSLSSWRAWIEICEIRMRVGAKLVALLMESVD